MLENARVTTALPAQDIGRARNFYTETLGLAVSRETGMDGTELQFDVADGTFIVFHSTGKPSGAHTQMAFTVDDVDGVAAALRGRGVVFEDVEGIDQEDGIATMGVMRGGWFKDSEGNLLSLIQELA